MTLALGWHVGIAPEVYHADPCVTPSLSASIATKLVNQSPAHAKLAHPRLGKGGDGGDDTSTDGQDVGVILHALVLGCHEHRIVEVNADNFRTKAAQEARDAARAQGKVPVIASKMDVHRMAANVIRARLEGEFGINLNGADSTNEGVAVWVERASDGTEVLCRAMIDSLLQGRGVAAVRDLKTTGDAKPKSCMRRICQDGYDIQGAAYVSAVEHLWPDLAGRVSHTCLFAEQDAPRVVTPIAFGEGLLELGQRKWQRAIDIWARCLASGEWHGYTTTVLTPEVPAWALMDEGE